MAMSFAALILSGVKSLANILVDTSIANTMSMPSVSILSACEEERGLAIHIIIRTNAAVNNTNGMCITTFHTRDAPLSHGNLLLTLK